jgi:hypothetical protein
MEREWGAMEESIIEHHDSLGTYAMVETKKIGGGGGIL